MNVVLAMVAVSKCVQTRMADIYVNAEQDSRGNPTIHTVVKVLTLKFQKVYIVLYSVSYTVKCDFLGHKGNRKCF